MSAPVLVLASGSPRRRELLAAAGYLFEVLPAEIDETLSAGESPVSGVVRLARAKARAAWRDLNDAPEGRLVLAADTLVVLGNEVFGKPKGIGEARLMLRRLSGRVHRVITGWCLKSSSLERAEAVTSEIRFRDLVDSEIEGYLAAGESMDKAGAYAIQGRGAFLVDWIRGSYPNIVGLPLAEVKAALDAALAEAAPKAGARIPDGR